MNNAPARRIPYSPLLALILISTLATPLAANPPQWIDGWQAAPSLNSARAGTAVVQRHGVIHVLGGIDGSRFLNTTEQSRINDDGSLSTWTAAQPMNEARGFFDAAVHGDYVYAVGGANGPNGSRLLNSVERAPILADGTLGPWQREQHTLNYPRRCSKVVVVGNTLYALGGYGGTLLDSVERAEILNNGHLGPWQLEAETLTLPRYVNAVKKTDQGLYVIGGHSANQGTGQREVEWAPLDHNGRHQPWRATTPTAIGRYGLGAAWSGDYLYALGGLNTLEYLNTIEKARIKTDGNLTTWQSTTALPMPLANFATLTHNNTLYLFGGTNNKGYFNTVSYAQINDNGDIGFYGHEHERIQTVKQATRALSLPNIGLVTETIQGGSYTYVHIDTATGAEWLAAATIELAMGDTVRYSDGVMMEDFYSNSLQRTFATIRFVGRLEKTTAP